jgi:hypothetical protein
LSAQPSKKKNIERKIHFGSQSKTNRAEENRYLKAQKVLRISLCHELLNYARPQAFDTTLDRKEAKSGFA